MDAALPLREEDRRVLGAALDDLSCTECGRCEWRLLDQGSPAALCAACGARLRIEGRILVGGRRAEASGLAQWTMERAAVAAIYERYWRPAVVRIAGGIGYPDELSFLSRWVTTKVDGRLLDLCCGTGWHLRTLAPQGFVLGVDASLPMLRRASGAARALGLRHAFVAEDVMRLRLRRPVDVAVFFGALHLMPDVVAALRHVRSLVAKDGVLAALAICDPAIASGEQRSNAIGFRLLSPAGYERGLAAAGFAVEEMRQSRAVMMFAARAR